MDPDGLCGVDPQWYAPGLGSTPWSEDRVEAESFFESENAPAGVPLQAAREKLYQKEKRMHFKRGE